MSKPLISCLWGCGESVNPPKLNIQEFQGGFVLLTKMETQARYPFFRIFYFQGCYFQVTRLNKRSYILTKKLPKSPCIALVFYLFTELLTCDWTCDMIWLGKKITCQFKKHLNDKTLTVIKYKGSLLSKQSPPPLPPPPHPKSILPTLHILKVVQCCCHFIVCRGVLSDRCWYPTPAIWDLLVRGVHRRLHTARGNPCRGAWFRRQTPQWFLLSVQDRQEFSPAVRRAVAVVGSVVLCSYKEKRKMIHFQFGFSFLKWRYTICTINTSMLYFESRQTSDLWFPQDFSCF